jgi:hypothetical protein
MNQRRRLDREDLESRFVFDLDKGEIRFRHTRKGSIAGKLAGTKLADGYVRVKIKPRSYYAHRLIYFMATGEEPDYIDHIDGNGWNNAISNLRPASNSENMCNHQSRSLQGTFLRHGKWHGRIMKNYKVHRIRPSPIKAVADWRLRLLRSEIHGEFAVAC